MPENQYMTMESLQVQLDSSPFIHFLQLRCESMDVEAGTLSLKMPMRAQLERFAGSGQYHGGPVASLVDTAGDFAVVMTTGGSVPTINFRIDYLRPSSGAFLVGKALIRKIGRTVGVVDVDVFDDQGRLTAVGRGCFGVPRPEISP